MRSMKSIWVMMAFLGFLLLGGLYLAPGASAADSVKLKVAIGFPETDAFSVNASEWMAMVSEKTDGRVKFTPYFAGSLLPLPEILDGVREGSADLGVMVASFTTGKIPGVAAFEGLGACPSDTAMYFEMLDKVEPIVASMFEEQGLVYLYMQPAYGINITAKDKYLKNMADFKGLKIRHAGRWGQRQLQCMGIKTVVLPPGGVYQALQTGVVDAAMGTNSFSLQFKWYEVAPHITSFDMIGNMNFVLMNKSSWKRVSADDKKIIREISKQAGRKAAEQIKQSQLDAVAKLESQGIKVHTWDANKRAEFLKATAQVWGEMKKVSGKYGGQLVDILNEYRR